MRPKSIFLRARSNARPLSRSHHLMVLLLSAWLMASNGMAQPAGEVVAWGDNYYGGTNVPAAAQSGVVAIAA